MRINVTKPFSYAIGAETHTHDVGEVDVPDELGQIATGAGWALVADEPVKAPATKARKAAPENK